MKLYRFGSSCSFINLGKLEAMLMGLAFLSPTATQFVCLSRQHWSSQWLRLAAVSWPSSSAYTSTYPSSWWEVQSFISTVKEMSWNAPDHRVPNDYTDVAGF